MALTAHKISSGSMADHGIFLCRSQGRYSVCWSIKKKRVHISRSGPENAHIGCQLTLKKRLCQEISLCGKPNGVLDNRGSSIVCWSKGTNGTDSKECVTTYNDKKDSTCISFEDKNDEQQLRHARGLAMACRYVYNDAKFVNERARNDIILLSRGIMRLDARARQDVAFLGTEFLKLDARAREDTERIDRGVKKKAERLHHIATMLKDKAKSRLKTVADEHWSDGALEADLRLADFRAKQRAMEDAFMALEFVKNIHDMMVRKMYRIPQDKVSPSTDGVTGHVMLEKNGKVDFFPREVSSDRISAIQEAYWGMASALSEADGIDYTDPEELELLIRTLIDLDAMDGKSSVSLLAECSSSPDDSTRQAVANALAAAPSMWTLGNAGMGALQRLAEDTNPAIAAAASKTINELKRQWEIEEGDSWRFTMDKRKFEEQEITESDEEADSL